jgi:hypothetical protein
VFTKGVGLVVGIRGDTKHLQGSLKTAERDVKGFTGKVGTLATGLLTLGAIKVGVDFLGGAAAEADRVADATTRLNAQLGPLAADLIDVSDEFHEIGLSVPDFQTLAANFADIATGLGISDPLIAAFADDAVRTAGAIALIKDLDPEDVIRLLGQAAGGSARAMRTLGVNVTDAEAAERALLDTGKKNVKALTDGEIAAARMALILEELAPVVDDVTTAEADLETRQKTLGAKWETFTSRVGQAVEGPLADLVQWFIDMTNAIPGAIKGFEMLDDRVRDLQLQAAEALKPLGDLWQQMMDLRNLGPFGGGLIPNFGTGHSAFADSSTGGIGEGGRTTVPININIYGDPAVVEAVVVRTLRTHFRHNGNAVVFTTQER